MIPTGAQLRHVLELERPLAMLDLETTGLFFTLDRVIQISITLHFPNEDPVKWKQLLNPEIPIPPEVTEIHHITDEDVKDAPLFKAYSKDLSEMLRDVDFGGQNVEFDLKMLRREFKLASVKWDWEKTDSMVIDSKRLDEIVRPRSLKDLYKYHRGHDLEDAHDAGTDVAASEEVMEAILVNNPTIPRRIPELSAFCFPKRELFVDRAGKFVWRHRKPVFAFGVHIGKPIENFKKYLDWMINVGDFPQNTKDIAQAVIDGKEFRR